MTTLTQMPRPGEYLMDDEDHERTHEAIVVASNQTLLAGQVVGAITVGAAPTVASAANGGNTGNGTNALAATPFLAGAQVGAYAVVFIAATKFEVFDPTGKFVAGGATGVAFANQVAFTITAGGTPFAAGDGFTITVTADATAGQIGALDVTATDGRASPIGVLFSPITTTSATKPGVITARARRVNGRRLTWPAGFSGGQIATATAQLKALGIIVRN